MGSHEAAALLGVHLTVVGRMASRGLISATVLDAAHSAAPTKRYAIYDGGECDRDFREYEDTLADRGTGRPRAGVHLRPAVLKHLGAISTPIRFPDAIGPAEASKILGVHVSFLGRMARAGEIVGRRPWSPVNASGLANSWIFSRDSCLANARKTKQIAASGRKPGRPRKKLC